MCPKFKRNGTNKDKITIISKGPSAFMHQWCVGSAAKGKWFEHRAWSLNFDHFHENDGDLQGTSPVTGCHVRAVLSESEFFYVLPTISE